MAEAEGFGKDIGGFKIQDHGDKAHRESWSACEGRNHIRKILF